MKPLGRGFSEAVRGEIDSSQRNTLNRLRRAPNKKKISAQRPFRSRLQSAWVTYGVAGSGLVSALGAGGATLAAGGSPAVAINAVTGGVLSTVMSMWHQRSKSRNESTLREQTARDRNKRVGDQTARIKASVRESQGQTNQRFDEVLAKLDESQSSLREENRGLRSENTDLRSENAVLRDRLAQLGASPFAGQQATIRSSAPEPRSRAAVQRTSSAPRRTPRSSGR